MTRLIRHPRRLGFIGFNILAVAVLGLGYMISMDSAEEGVAGLPNLAVGTTMMVLAAVVWAGTWLAWGWMVWLRRRRVVRHRHGAA